MSEKKGLVREFREFALRGNVIDLAVGVVIGTAFTAVTTSLVGDVLTPLTGVFGAPDFGDLQFDVGQATVNYGLFLNAVLAFLLVALAVYVFVVKPVNSLRDCGKDHAPPPVTDRQCPECLSTISKAATRCAYCTSVVQALD